jgi:hypothetical protein
MMQSYLPETSTVATWREIPNLVPPGTPNALTFKEFGNDRKSKRRSRRPADSGYFFKVQTNWPAACMAKMD